MGKAAKQAAERAATLNIEGQSYEFPIIEGTTGPDAIDMRSLYKQSGMFSHDPGFLSTSSCRSEITFIDGEKGILRHRGYDIADLAEHCNYLEVVHLLLNGDLPDEKEYEEFERSIKLHTMVHEQLDFLYRGFPRRSHPMAILVGAVASLSAFYHDSLDIFDEEQRDLAARRMIAKMPTLTAMAFKYSIGQPFVQPLNKLGFAENFLHMMFAVPAEEYKMPE